MLVIFDCDGVLVDSEHLAAEVFSRALRKVDIDMSPQACFAQFKGHTLDYCQAWLQDHFAQFPDNFLDILGTDTRKAFSSSLQAVPGIEEVLLFLRQHGIPFCVASNGGHAKIRHSLQVTGLLDYFPDARFSRDDVVHGKPAPDLFLHAAAVMGVDPTSTVVVEDSPAGVQAARAAAMQALFYQASGSAMALPAGVTGFSAMKALPELLSDRVLSSRE